MEKEIKITPPEGYDNAEPECRNATKNQFFSALSNLCEAWKGTISDCDFREVLFKFDKEVIMPELIKSPWIKIKTRRI